MQATQPNTPIMAAPDVSFVIPAYNAAPFIGQALDSLMVQKGCAFEIVVVDDASTDGTAAIVKQRAASSRGRIRLLSMPHNSGCVFSPRRMAIENARAGVVAPLDADDWVDGDYLERLWRRRLDTGADIVYPTMYAANPGTKPLRLVPHEGFDTGRVWRGRDLVPLTIDGWQIGAGGGLLTRSLYLECFAAHDYPAKVYMDEVLTRHLLCLAPKTAIDPTPYYYRTNPASVTHHVAPRLFDFLEADRELVELMATLLPGDQTVQTKAARQLMHGFFNGIRLLHRATALTPTQRAGIIDRLETQRRHIDRPRLRGNASPRYMALARLHTRAVLRLLPLYDRLVGKI